MLLAGMAIAEVPLKKVFCTPRNYLPVALRLLAVPMVVLLLLSVIHASTWIADGKAILMTVFLSAITPACATVTSMAQLYTTGMQRIRVPCMYSVHCSPSLQCPS